MSGPFKMKGFSAHAGVSPMKRETAQSRKDKNDPILQGAIKTAKKNAPKTSKKIGPAESPEAIDKKYKKVFSERDKIRATAKKGDSFKKMWVADNLVKMLRWNRKSHSTPYLSEIKRGIYFNFGLPKSTIYRPQMAKMIVTGLNGEVVLDPCAGWGGRLLGAVSSNAHYIGFEPNIKTYNGLLKLSKFLNIQDKVTLICDVALNIDKYDIGELDFDLQ